MAGQEEESSLLLNYGARERQLLQKPALIKQAEEQRAFTEYVHVTMTKLGFVARDKPLLTYRAMAAVRSRAFSVKVGNGGQTSPRFIGVTSVPLAAGPGPILCSAIRR